MITYRILSPDGFDISFDQQEYKKSEVLPALKAFQARFITQGHYTTSDRIQIPYEDIIDMCQIIENK